MPHAPLIGALLLLTLSDCGDPRRTVDGQPSPLDFVELDGGDGWKLVVYGDGSGSLTHRQYPTHHLDYPVATFELGKLIPRASRSCRPDPGGRADCYRLRYHRANRKDKRCDCMDRSEAETAFTRAIARMQIAVDDGGSKPACRMLRRAWLAAR